jgi:hypothetical protein
MSNKSLAHPGTEATTTEDLEPIGPIAQRVLRGQRLFKDHAEAFMHKRGMWYVPSDSGCAFYAVRLGPVETCECQDYEYRAGRCKHIHAASIAQAKSSVCSCCGHRVLGRSLSEVEEEDYLLSWFVGDALCADCIRAGYWS